MNFQGTLYYIKEAPIIGSILPALLPSGRYKVEVNITYLHTNDTYIYITGIGDVRNKPIVFWK